MKESDFIDFTKLEITVVGLGLIGGSIAMALRKCSPKKIWAVDIDKDTLHQAWEQGIIDGGFTDGSEPLKKSDLVIISLYPDRTIGFVKEHMEDFKENAIITDTAGIKKKVIGEIWAFLREDLDFVGGHPLAGREGSGFCQASADIFQGANYLLTPAQSNKKESLGFVEKMIKTIGCKDPIYMKPEEHDRIIALTSQLPHVIAASLVNCSLLEDTGALIGGSFRDATRVARMNVDLWTELLLENRENILTQMEVFIDNITSMKQMLVNEDRDCLDELLRKANDRRETF